MMVTPGVLNTAASSATFAQLMSGDWSALLGIIAMVNVAWGANMDAWKQGMKEEEMEKSEDETPAEATDGESPESD